jgi:hypothetical protein
MPNPVGFFRIKVHCFLIEVDLQIQDLLEISEIFPRQLNLEVQRTAAKTFISCILSARRRALHLSNI